MSAQENEHESYLRERDFWRVVETWVSEQSEPVGRDDLPRLLAVVMPRFPEGMTYIEKALNEMAVDEEHLTEEEQLAAFEASPIYSVVRAIVGE